MVSSEQGPYLRIDREPEVRDNFLDEYQVAVREGLGAAHGAATAATATHGLWALLALLVLAC